jgi:replication-associated recombination protein RarA
VISTLQKSIRRGLTENALLTAYEMTATSPELEEYMWTRLTVIAVEDVGLGDPNMPILIDVLYRNHLRYARGVGDRFLFAAHAVRVLSAARKDRGSDEMAGWTRATLGPDHLPEIPDYALDMHTRRGTAMGRDARHFLEEASRVTNEVPDRDLTYRHRLRELKGA